MPAGSVRPAAAQWSFKPASCLPRESWTAPRPGPGMGLCPLPACPWAGWPCAAWPLPAPGPVDQREVQRSVHRRVSAQYQRKSGQALPPSDTISRAGNLVPHNQQDCTAGFARETIERSSPAMFGPPPGSIGRLPGKWTRKQPAPRAADSTTVPEVWHADGPPSTHSAGCGQPIFSRGALPTATRLFRARRRRCYAVLHQFLAREPHRVRAHGKLRGNSPGQDRPVTG
jgi:hypothetical protein